jgi:hypothetical protein
VIGEEPLSLGAAHVIVIVVFPASTVTIFGAAGGVIRATGSEKADSAERPFALLAATAKT